MKRMKDRQGQLVIAEGVTTITVVRRIYPQKDYSLRGIIYLAGRPVTVISPTGNLWNTNA